jgi:hypothetical protein
LGNDPTTGRFQVGQAANPGGRLKGQSRVLLWFLGRAMEAGEIIVDLARNAKGDPSEKIRLAACREILDRGLGKAPQSVDLAVDLSVNKRLDEMTTDELLEFKKRYVAMTTAAPALIEQVLADDEANEEQAEFDLNDDRCDLGWGAPGGVPRTQNGAHFCQRGGLEHARSRASGNRREPRSQRIVPGRTRGGDRTTQDGSRRTASRDEAWGNWRRSWQSQR